MKSQYITKYLTPDIAVQAREEVNLSQAKVAAETGISRSYLNQFESSKRILEDDQLEVLWDFYVAQGWKPDPAIQEKSIEQKINNLDHGLTIMDGFVVTQGASQNYVVEDLMGEYYGNSKKIAELKSQEIKRGFFGNFIEDEALKVSIEIFTIMSRQDEIVQILHGKSEDVLDDTAIATAIAGDMSGIKTAGQYIQTLVAATLKNRVLPATLK